MNFCGRTHVFHAFAVRLLATLPREEGAIFPKKLFVADCQSFLPAPPNVVQYYFPHPAYDCASLLAFSRMGFLPLTC